MNDPTAHALARQRAQLIMQVRSGMVTAEAAARQLGVSRKTYYKWERRALTAMVGALGTRAQGRPPQPDDPETAALRRQLTALQAKLTVLEQTEQLRQRLAQPDKKTRGGDRHGGHDPHGTEAAGVLVVSAALPVRGRAVRQFPAVDGAPIAAATDAGAAGPEEGEAAAAR